MDQNLIRCAEIMRVFNGNINGLGLTLQYYSYKDKKEAMNALETKLKNISPNNQETISALHTIVTALNRTDDDEYKWARKKILETRP